MSRQSFVAYTPTLPVGQTCTPGRRHVFHYVKVQSLLTDAEGRLLPRQAGPDPTTRCQCDLAAWEDEPSEIAPPRGGEDGRDGRA